MNQSKTYISNIRKLVIACFIDRGFSTVPLLMEATGMTRRTLQEAIKAMSDVTITCRFEGATKSGRYIIDDWGLIQPKELILNLQHYTGVLNLVIEQPIINIVSKDRSMSEQKIMKALYNQQRLQILSLGVHHKEYSDSYLFAWYTGVYPLFEDTDGSVTEMPHEVHSSCFRITKEKVDHLTKLLDDAWITKAVPTFYELERDLGVQYSGEWSRMELINICKYLYLKGDSWDEDFWSTLLKPQQYPSEARSIIRKFDRVKDIYFE